MNQEIKNLDQVERIRLLESIRWGEPDFAQEREFVENLFVGRFNLFLLMFSIFLTAGFANTFQTYKWVVFLGGDIVLFLFWLTLQRAFHKHDMFLKLMFGEAKTHPAFAVEKLLKLNGYKPKFRNTILMAYTIPFVCMGILAVSGVAVLFDILK